MNKPIPRTNITIQLPDTMSKEDQQKYTQEILKKIREEDAQEKRDYEMYQKGRRDSSGGPFGSFGGLF